jgi:hypothetical protein
MFEERGYPMAIYDPFYAADESVLESDYDFVTATEVIEHVQRPQQSLKRMWRCVKAGGYLGIMTQLVIDQDAFAKWHYKNDETHICFYSQATFGWLARQWETEPVFVGQWETGDFFLPTIRYLFEEIAGQIMPENYRNRANYGAKLVTRISPHHVLALNVLATPWGPITIFSGMAIDVHGQVRNPIQWTQRGRH